jgi:hypothetical protein
MTAPMATSVVLCLLDIEMGVMRAGTAFGRDGTLSNLLILRDTPAVYTEKQSFTICTTDSVPIQSVLARGILRVYMYLHRNRKGLHLHARDDTGVAKRAEAGW